MKIVNRNEDSLGESPSWLSPLQRFYWVDIMSRKYHWIGQDSKIGTASVPDTLSSLHPGISGFLMGTFQDTFVRIEPGSQRIQKLAKVNLVEGVRFNDGKCDRLGNFWAGTMDVGEKDPKGSLYVLYLNGEVHELLSGLTISNGLCWDYGEHMFYHIDTPTKAVRAFDFREDHPDIWNPRILVDLSGEAGVPDGMTIDSCGNIWIAHWGGSHLSVWNPGTGKKLGSIKLPAVNITSCSFDTEEDLLAVTSAKLDRKDSNLDSDLGGSLFILDKSDFRQSGLLLF